MKKLLIFLLTATAFTLFAEENKTTKQDTADLYVNVTAARELKETEAVPAFVTVITKEDMKGHSVSEALTIYSGIGFSSTANSDTTASPLLRGFSENSHGRVLVMIDGVKLNNPDMSAINWLSIPEDRIERIEVIKGGNSSLYGDNAVAAVINIITSTPDGKTCVKADISGGSNDSYSKSISASAGGEKLSLTVSAEDKKTDGWRERTGYESTDFSGKIGYKPFEKYNMSVSLIYSDSEYEMPGSLTEDKYEDDPEQAVNKEDFAENTMTQVSCNNSYELNNLTDINLTASCSKKNTIANFESYYSAKYTDTEIDTFSVSPSVIFTIPGLLWGSSFNTGIDYNFDKLNKKIYSDFLRTAKTDDTDLTRNTFGFYTRAESYLLEKLALSVSARFETGKLEAEFEDSDLDNDKTYSPFVYGAGLSYIFAENSKIYLSYNKLFRYPFFDEQVSYSGSTPGFTKDLDPEKGDSFEAGVEYNNFKYARGGINFFCLLMDDEIASNALWENENLDKTIHYGAETYLIVTPVDIFSTRFNYNYTVAKFTEGDNDDNSLPLTPAHSFTIIPEIRAFDIIKVYTEFAYTGEMYGGGDKANDSDKMDSYFLTNTGLSVSLNYDKADIKVYMDVDNLFDVDYVPLVHYSGYYPGSGREITVGSSISF